MKSPKYRAPDSPSCCGSWKPADREKYPLRPGYQRNKGAKPQRAKGKRVYVALMDGEDNEDEIKASTVPPGWAADTTRWTLTGCKFDVDQYKIL